MKLPITLGCWDWEIEVIKSLSNNFKIALARFGKCLNCVESIDSVFVAEIVGVLTHILEFYIGRDVRLKR